MEGGGSKGSRVNKAGEMEMRQGKEENTGLEQDDEEEEGGAGEETKFQRLFIVLSEACSTPRRAIILLALSLALVVPLTYKASKVTIHRRMHARNARTDSPAPHTHTRARARTYARTHGRTDARTDRQTHARTQTSTHARALTPRTHARSGLESRLNPLRPPVRLSDSFTGGLNGI